MYNFNPYQPYEQGLVRVTGIDGARAYQMRPNSTVALFDANNDYFRYVEKLAWIKQMLEM